MSSISLFFRRVFLWTYSRGSWQWDLMVLFFLLCIFGTPRSFLEGYSQNPMPPDQIHALVKAWLSSLL
jgi:hypothetical protein